MSQSELILGMQWMGVGWGDREGTKKHGNLAGVAPSTVLRRWSSPQAGGRGAVEICGHTVVVGSSPKHHDSVSLASVWQNTLIKEKRPLGEKLQQHFSKFPVYTHHVGIL